MERGLYRVRNVDKQNAMEWQAGGADFYEGEFNGI